MEDQRDAVLIITVEGEMGEASSPIPYDAPESDIKRWASEIVSSGEVSALTPRTVDFSDYVVDRIPARGDQPDRIQVRPKTSFGK